MSNPDLKENIRQAFRDGVKLAQIRDAFRYGKDERLCSWSMRGSNIYFGGLPFDHHQLCIILNEVKRVLETEEKS